MGEWISIFSGYLLWFPMNWAISSEPHFFGGRFSHVRRWWACRIELRDAERRLVQIFAGEVLKETCGSCWVFYCWSHIILVGHNRTGPFLKTDLRYLRFVPRPLQVVCAAPKLHGTSWNFMNYDYWLVVWNMNFLTFHSVGNVMIPIFQRGRAQPPTRLSFPEVLVSLGILVSFLKPSKTSAGLWNFAAGLPAADLRLPLARRRWRSTPGTTSRFRAADEDRSGLSGHRPLSKKITYE